MSGLRIKRFGCQSDSDQGFIKRTCPGLTHPLLSVTTTETVTAPATTSSATPTYCMEEPPTSLTPHPNESHRHHHRDERPPSRQQKTRRRTGKNLELSKDNPRSGNVPELDTAGGRATPSTPRSASPDKANDSSTPQPHRRNKPKHKSSGALGIQDSGRNPTKVKLPTNESGSQPRRYQGKPDGGDPKPPRPGSKTAPGHKEPKVGSEPIHDPADPVPSHPKQDHPRRRRQGKIDGKLTTGDGEPSQEGRYTNPNREKYRVDYAADDLTSRLIHDLRTPPFLDCAICFNAIRPHEPTWSCSPSTPVTPTEGSLQAQYCWATLHLKCVRSWASKSIADIRQAYEARGEDKPGQWSCTGCRARRTIEPSSYRCAFHCPPPPPDPVLTGPIYQVFLRSGHQSKTPQARDASLLR